MAPSSHEPKGRQGFASMSPELRREISRKGGQSIPAQKRAFSQGRSWPDPPDAKVGSPSAAIAILVAEPESGSAGSVAT
jgi:general stress protein YciG